MLVLTEQGMGATNRLSGWALERGYDLAGFSVSQPTLEDIYLSLTQAAVGDSTTEVSR